MCEQSFNNLGKQINVLHPTELKGHWVLQAYAGAELQKEQLEWE